MAGYPNLYQTAHGMARSPAGRLDARLKVFLLAVLSLTIWKVDSLTGLGIISALLVFWLSLHRAAFRAVYRSLKKLLYVFFLILAYYCWAKLSRAAGSRVSALESATVEALLLGGKLAVLLAASLWLYLCTAPMKVVAALTSVLRPLEKFRVPVRELAFTVGLIIRFFPSSVARLRDLYRTLQLRDSLPASGDRLNRYKRAVTRVIDTMVLYMHYSLYESQLLTLSLMSRGYNPFRPVRLTSAAPLSAGDLIFFTVSMIVIIWTAYKF